MDGAKALFIDHFFAWHHLALAATAGLRSVDDERRVLYSDLIEAALSEAARKALYMLPEGYEFQSKAVRESFLKGRASEKAADVLDVLDARGLTVSDEQRERILGCSDLEVLKTWLRRAATVATSDELFV